MTTPERTLVLMRHAKAEPFGSEDHERRLTDRGRRNAREAGAWLASRGLIPDHALVSSAARTVDTWEEVVAGSTSSATPTYDDSLYTAGPESALELVNAVDPAAGVLILIGHNPTVAYLANLLSGPTPDPDAFREMSQGYPPAALTVFEVPGAWSDLTEASARVTAFHVGHA